MELVFSPASAQAGTRVKVDASQFFTTLPVLDHLEVYGYATPDPSSFSEEGFAEIAQLSRKSQSAYWDTSLWKPGKTAIVVVGYNLLNRFYLLHWHPKYADAARIIVPPVLYTLTAAQKPLFPSPGDIAGIPLPTLTPTLIIGGALIVLGGLFLWQRTQEG